MRKNNFAVVVDDDIKILMLLEKILTGMGFLVFKAEEGNKAFELVKREKPDLLVTDILIPGLDGLSLCKAIHEDPEITDTRVIMITGIYNETTYKLESDGQADAFIEKPIDVKQFESVVQGIFGD